MTHSIWWQRQERGVEGRRSFPYRGGPVARVAAPTPSVSLPAAASPAATTPTTPTTAPRWLAVVVPVTISVLAGAFAAVLLTGHAQTVVVGGSFPGFQPLVQTAGLQVVPAVKQKQKQKHKSKTRTRKRRSSQEQPSSLSVITLSNENCIWWC